MREQSESKRELEAMRTLVDTMKAEAQEHLAGIAAANAQKDDVLAQKVRTFSWTLRSAVGM